MHRGHTAIAGDQHAPDRLRSAPIEGSSSQERSIGDPSFLSPHVVGQTLTGDQYAEEDEQLHWHSKAEMPEPRFVQP
jgi:hypothetical protein